MQFKVHDHRHGARFKYLETIVAPGVAPTNIHFDALPTLEKQ
jgi:hypothetical protein